MYFFQIRKDMQTRNKRTLNNKRPRAKARGFLFPARLYRGAIAVLVCIFGSFLLETPLRYPDEMILQPVFGVRARPIFHDTSVPEKPSAA